MRQLSDDAVEIYEGLNLIFGPPGRGAFAFSHGNYSASEGGDNAPGRAFFFPNTDEGRIRYANSAANASEEGRNAYLNSALWDEEMLKVKLAPLTMSGDKPVVPLSFPVLWCDVDHDDYNRELLETLRRKGSLINTSGGRTKKGKAKFHVRVLLNEPITDVDEFYQLNMWLSRALGGEKYAPVSWLTTPGTKRYKPDYPGGVGEVKLVHKRVMGAWTVKELKQELKKVCDAPDAGELTGRTDGGLEEEPFNLGKKEYLRIKRLVRQADPGDGAGRYNQTYKLVRSCAEAGLSKGNALWALTQHEPTVNKHRGQLGRLVAEVQRCWPVTKVEQKARVEYSKLPGLDGEFDLDWLMKQDLPELQWCVPGLIPEGVGLLVSPPKTGKSWLVLGIALACAAGGYALGKIKVDQRPVMYMALEDSHLRLKNRSKALLNGEKSPKMTYRLNVNLESPEGPIQTIVDWLEQNRGALVIVDTLGKIKPADSGKGNSFSQDYKYMSLFKQAVAMVPGTTILLVHHTRKTADDNFVNMVSGTQGVAGSVDFIMSLQRKAEGRDAVLSVTGRDVEGGDFTLTTPGGGAEGIHWTLQGDSLDESARVTEKTSGAAGRIQTNTDRVLEFVQNRCKITPDAESVTNEDPQVRGHNTEQVKSVMTGDVVMSLGITPESARVYLNRLVNAGKLDRAGRGSFRPVG